MMRIALLLITLLTARAGNEASGNWVRFRFKARAWEALSEACRRPETERLLTRRQIADLEAAIESTPIETVADTDPDLRGDGGRLRVAVLTPARTLKLRRQRWELFLDRRADVF